MISIFSVIVEADILGVEASLYSRLGSSKNKNIYGGIISILMMMLIISGTLFFVIEFLERKNFSLVSSFSNNPNLSFLRFDEVPFMFRISGDTGRSFSADYYNAILRTGSFDENVNSTHYIENVRIESCDLDKHLSKYKNLFNDIKEINTYYCPVWNRTFDIHGIYGSTNFTYANLFFSLCRGRNCKSTNITKPALAASYFDFITVTNKINHDEISQVEKILHKSRVLVSNTIYKRIWYFFEKIEYISDFGYIFEEKVKETFNNFKEYKVDVDLRNVDNTNFLWVTLTNYVDETKFTRGYMKAQAMFANIGGIINGLIVCGMIVTFPVANNLASESLVSSIFDKDLLKISLDESNNKHNQLCNIKISNNFMNNNTNEASPNHRKENVWTNKADIKNLFNKIKELKEITLDERAVRENIKNTTSKHLLNSNSNTNIIKCINPNTEKNIVSTSNKKKIGTKSNIFNKENISKNNYVSIDVNNQQQESNNNNNNNNNKYILTKDNMKLNKLNLLDPFLCCLEKKKKIHFKKNLEKGHELLNISNLSVLLQQFNAIKSLILDESQADFIETLFNFNPHNCKLSKLFNKINTEFKNDSINKKIISLCVRN